MKAEIEMKTTIKRPKNENNKKEKQLKPTSKNQRKPERNKRIKR